MMKIKSCLKRLLKKQTKKTKYPLVNPNGRPRLEIDKGWLLLGKHMGLSNKELARQIGCSDKTIRRRLKEYGITEDDYS